MGNDASPRSPPGGVARGGRACYLTAMTVDATRDGRRPLGELETRDVALLLFDIDGTVTAPDGRIPGAVFRALERAQEAGLLTMPVTGRPGGWCDMIARTWPVDGVVGENGGLAFRRAAPGQAMERRFWQEAPARAEARDRLAALGRQILSDVPGAALASDQSYRDLDLAVDFCEDVPDLGDAEVSRIVAGFEVAGATCKVSNIHVNGWFGAWDKLGMCVAVARDWFGLDLTGADRARVVFVGDSPNDAPMFGAFPRACGVANIRRYLDGLEHAPAFITGGDGACGFVEVVERLLGAR